MFWQWIINSIRCLPNSTPLVVESGETQGERIENGTNRKVDPFLFDLYARFAPFSLNTQRISKTEVGAITLGCL